MRAIVLIDHGSRLAAANAQLEQISAEVSARLPDWIVRTAHLDVLPPSLAQAIDECAQAGASSVIVHPHFLAPGQHTTHDIPALVEATRARHPDMSITITAPLGDDSRITDIVVDRATAAQPPIDPAR